MSVKATTQILRRSRKGDTGASAELFSLVYEELRKIAAAYFRSQPAGHTLQPTAIVHEAYLRLIEQTESEWEDKSHFLGIAARVMRLVLVDYTRRRRAIKRGGDAVRIPLSEIARFSTFKGADLFSLNECLEKLEKLDEQKAKIVDLRVFLGMTVEETAQVLGASAKSVERHWAGARAWLRVHLED